MIEEYLATSVSFSSSATNPISIARADCLNLDVASKSIRVRKPGNDELKPFDDIGVI